MKTFALYLVTALAEIGGCYLPWLWLKEGRSVWLLVPGAFSLALFAWLLTLHETAAGRTYAAYGGVYIGVAIGWLWVVEGVRPTGRRGRDRRRLRHGDHRAATDEVGCCLAKAAGYRVPRRRNRERSIACFERIGAAAQRSTGTSGPAHWTT